jgi:hypothetical protein
MIRELFLTIQNYIDFNEISNNIINKNFFIQFYPTNFSIKSSDFTFLGKPLVFNEYYLKLLEEHKQISSFNEKTVYYSQLKEVNGELYRYMYQRVKFIGIINNITNGTENFYPNESIYEFRSNIGLLNILINNLLKSSVNLRKLL